MKIIWKRRRTPIRFSLTTLICARYRSTSMPFRSTGIHIWRSFTLNVTLDFTTHYVEEGDIILILPGRIHGISQYSSYSMEYENIIFSVDLFRSRNHDTLDSEFFLPLLSGELNIKSIYDRDDPLYNSLSSCLNRVDALCASTPKGYRLALKSCYFEFFYTLYAHVPKQSYLISIETTKKQYPLQTLLLTVDSQNPILCDFLRILWVYPLPPICVTSG